MKHLIIAAALCLALPALAQTNAGSQSGSVASTANTNNPTFNYIAPAANPHTTADFRTNQAASGPSVFVNPPGADTCDRAGLGISVGAVGGNAGLNIPRGQSDKCDMRADTINLKVVGAPPAVIKARHCMDAQMAEAYARAGIPCKDMRGVDWSGAEGEGYGLGTPVAKQPEPWKVGG